LGNSTSKNDIEGKEVVRDSKGGRASEKEGTREGPDEDANLQKSSSWMPQQSFKIETKGFGGSRRSVGFQLSGAAGGMNPGMSGAGMNAAGGSQAPRQSGAGFRPGGKKRLYAPRVAHQKKIEKSCAPKKIEKSLKSPIK
jgi:hypothetical protein